MDVLSSSTSRENDTIKKSLLMPRGSQRLNLPVKGIRSISKQYSKSKITQSLARNKKWSLPEKHKLAGGNRAQIVIVLNYQRLIRRSREELGKNSKQRK